MNTNEYIIYPQIQAIEPTENMKNQEIINKRHRIQGGIMLIGGLVFAAVITAYAYNGDTNIFTFIGVGITLAGSCAFLKMSVLLIGVIQNPCIRIITVNCIKEKMTGLFIIPLGLLLVNHDI